MKLSNIVHRSAVHPLDSDVVMVLALMKNPNVMVNIPNANTFKQRFVININPFMCLNLQAI